MPSPNRPNILFISVDALRADRTSMCGYPRPTTPTLDRLAQNAIVCDRAVSTAAFTQASFHSFLTSSPVFAGGGYDGGVHDRPSTLFSHLAKHGYKAYVFSTFQWVSEIFGYCEGVEHFENLYVLNALVGTAEPILREPLQSFAAGKISTDDLVAIVDPFLLKLFAWIERYCDELSARIDIDTHDFANSRLTNDGYKYSAVKKLIATHRAEYLTDRHAYVERYLSKPFQPHEYLGTEWRYFRHAKKLVSEAVFVLSNRLLSLVAPRRAKLRKMRLKRYVDGKELADRVIRRIREHDSDKPWVMWTHFIDTHVPYCAGTAPNWYDKTPDYLAMLGYPQNLDVSIAVNKRPKNDAEMATWSALYDAAVLYVDEQIGRIVDALDASGQGKNTLIVICGDHGEEFGEHGDISHHFRCHSHNMRVPLLFHHPEFDPARNDELVSLLDLAPTIANLIGVNGDPRWAGKSVTDSVVAERQHLILETVHGGTCDLEQRPIYMSVRDKRFNYLWKEYRDRSDLISPEGDELYDYESDPAEQINLYQPDHPVVLAFKPLIARRLAEVPEISDERIIKAFGDVGRAALSATRTRAE